MKSIITIMGSTLMTILSALPSDGQSISAVSGGGGGMGGMSGGGGSFGPSAMGYVTYSKRGSDTPFVIQFSDPGVADQGALEEDISVMSVLLHKTMEKAGPFDARSQYKMGIPMIISGARSSENLYIEGFGAVFVMNVGFPLIAAPTPAAPGTRSTASSEWEAARKQLHGKEDSGSYAIGGEYPGVPYNGEVVDTLKKDLIRSLQNAVNIRGLKQEDMVAVTVVGTESAVANAEGEGGVSGGEIQSGGKSEATTGLGGGGGASGRRGGALEIKNGMMKTGGSRSSVLAIKASKTNIDLLAAGKMSLEDFTKTVQVRTYFVAKNSQHASATTFGSSYSTAERK